jgi:hypothetical protein
MRKTRLLLDAVLAAGRRDVTFCALDLCQQSLSDALQALQGMMPAVQQCKHAQHVGGGLSCSCLAIVV